MRVARVKNMTVKRNKKRRRLKRKEMKKNVT
jgi:hypothetical protein